jgi:hypothetical protein
MTTPLLILAAAAVWAAGLALVVALCRMAAQGDQWKDDFSLERAALQLPRSSPGKRLLPGPNRLRDLEGV